jgi:tRNA G18 (ribose-2'-O)-methylase SpoU
MNQSICLILDNIRSSHNVGSIFRTADAAGVAKIYLTGYTPAPTDRFGRVNKEIAKTALGAERAIAWEKVGDISVLISKLKAEGYKIIALEQAENSISYREVKLTGPTVVIVGNEVKGISEEILKQCDVVAEIPMRGSKESLNVAVASGIFLFHLLG